MSSVCRAAAAAPPSAGLLCVGLFAAGLLAAGTAAAVPQYFMVGDLADPRCQFATITQAINAAAANGPELDYIMVANNAGYSGQALSIFGQSVLIEGGYADCELNVDSGQPFTPISGNGSDPVLRIEPFAAGSYEVRLSHLQISGGGNTSSDGGGIALRPWTNTFVKLVLESTEVSNNRASRGGGIYAVRGTAPGGQFALVLRAGTRISDNSAANTGGGLYLIDGQLQMETHDVRIARNSAGGGGGGMALFNSTALIGNPEGRAPRSNASGAVVEQNSAGTLGGGIYLSGGPALMEAHELIVDGNTAAGSGGGIAAANGARLTLLRDDASGLGWYCPASAECTRLSNNQAGDGTSSGTRGGALALYSSARATLAQAVVRNNKAQDGAAVFVDSARLEAEGVLFTANQSYDPPNQGSAIVRATYLAPAAPAELQFAYSTFVANTRNAAGTPLPGLDIAGWQQTAFSVYSSAFFDSPYPWVMYGPHVSDCVIRRGGGVLDGNGMHSRAVTTSLADSAVFLKPAVADWHLRFNSPLVDYCDSGAYIARYRDRDLQPRCRDDAKPNSFGSCDIGAWENDQLFADAFGGS